MAHHWRQRLSCNMASVCVYVCTCVSGFIDSSDLSIQPWELSEYPNIDWQRHLWFPGFGLSSLLLWSNIISTCRLPSEKMQGQIVLPNL